MKIGSGLILVAGLILIIGAMFLVGCDFLEHPSLAVSSEQETTFIGKTRIDTIVCTATSRCDYDLLLIEHHSSEAVRLKYNSERFLTCADETVDDDGPGFGFKIVGIKCNLGFEENKNYKITGSLEYDSIEKVNYIKIKKYEKLN